MEKIIVELEAKTDKALKGIDNVAKSVEELGKEVSDSNKQTTKSLKGVESASKGVAKGVKAVGTGLKAIGLGLIIGALGTLKELFEQNQKAVDFFSIAFETASVVVGQMVTAFTNVYESVAKSSENFDALGKVMDGLLTLVVNPFKMQFYSLKIAFEAVQLAYEKMFGDEEGVNKVSKEIDKTKQKLKDLAKSQIEAYKIIANNFTEAATEVGAISSKVIEEVGKISIKTALETAKVNTELTKSAQIAAAMQGLIFEKFDRQAEKLRQIRDEERNSLADRKKANDDLLIALNNAEQAMLSQAKMQLTIANANLKKDKNNIEFKVAQIEALKELAGVEAQIEGIRSEQKANDLALDRESIELTNSKTESESFLSIERKRFNAELIEDELLRLEKLREIDELEAEQESLRLEAILLNANAGTQAKIDAQIALDEFTEKSRQTGIKRDSEISKAELALIEKKRKAKLRAFDDLVKIGGAETKFGKAMLIAKQLMLAKELIMEIKSTIMKAKQAAIAAQIKAAGAGVDITTGAAKSASALPFPFNVPLIIGFAAQAVGIISSIKGAMSAQKSATSGIGISTPSVNLSAPRSSVSSSLPSQPTIASTPPSFNTVGASGTNQLASAIGGQSQQPIQAFVVSSEVTTAQELDNNIVQSASL